MQQGRRLHVGNTIEGRFSATEQRYAVQEERKSRMLSLIVRIAERQASGNDAAFIQTLKQT